MWVIGDRVSVSVTTPTRGTSRLIAKVPARHGVGRPGIQEDDGSRGEERNSKPPCCEIDTPIVTIRQGFLLSFYYPDQLVPSNSYSCSISVSRWPASNHAAWTWEALVLIDSQAGCLVWRPKRKRKAFANTSPVGGKAETVMIEVALTIVCRYWDEGARE